MNIAILFSDKISGFQRSIQKYREYIFENNPVHIFIAHNSCNNEDLSFLKAYANVHAFSGVYKMPDDGPITYLESYSDPTGYYLSSMWYHRYLAYKIMKDYSIINNVKFDIVISATTGLIITSTFNIYLPHENTIYIPNNSDYDGINDKFAYGSMNSMEIYCNLYKNVKTRTRRPEILLNDYLMSTGININRIELNYYLPSATC